jgi:hypothetical protein
MIGDNTYLAQGYVQRVAAFKKVRPASMRRIPLYYAQTVSSRLRPPDREAADSEGAVTDAGVWPPDGIEFFGHRHEVA